MNQYRCETCTHNKTQPNTILYRCAVRKNRITLTESVWIDDMGCASRSSYQSDRDKVLDGDWVRDKFFEWVNSRERPPSLYACEQQWKKLVELRQAGEP